MLLSMFYLLKRKSADGAIHYSLFISCYVCHYERAHHKSAVAIELSILL